jgi:hypothetical protein
MERDTIVSHGSLCRDMKVPFCFIKEGCWSLSHGLVSVPWRQGSKVTNTADIWYFVAKISMVSFKSSGMG